MTMTTQDLDRKAYEWAKANQGFAGDYAAWQSLPAAEREAYEVGAGKESPDSEAIAELASEHEEDCYEDEGEAAYGRED